MSRRRSTRRKKLPQDLDDPPTPISNPTVAIPNGKAPSIHTTPQAKPASPPQSPLSPISPWPPITAEPIAYDDTPTIARDELHGETVPTAKEVYGFVAVILTVLGYWTYLAWSFFPPHWLDAVGWTWYPERQWAIVIPCYLMVLVLLTYLAYGGLTAYMTPSFDSPIYITDPYSNIPHRPADTSFNDVFRRLMRGETTEAVDIPIDMVNRTLYPARKRSGDG